MLKIVVRTLIILLVAGLVAAGVYLFTVSGGMSRLGADGPERISRPAPDGTAISAEGSARPSHFDGEHDNQDGFSLVGLVGVLFQGVKIAAITALVVLVKAAGHRASHRKAGKVPAA